MNSLSTKQLAKISGASVHWFPNDHGGLSAPGSNAQVTIANSNGGKIPTEIGSEGLGIVGGVIGGALGTLLGPVGGAMGAMLGQTLKLLGPAIKEVESQGKH